MGKHSPDIAVSSGDHPVLIDQGTSTEVESVGLLSLKKERPGLLQVAKTRHAEVQVEVHDVIMTSCLSKAHLQRHLPGPGVGDGLLTIDNAGVASHLGSDGWGAAAWPAHNTHELRDEHDHFKPTRVVCLLDQCFCCFRVTLIM